VRNPNMPIMKTAALSIKYHCKGTIF